MDGDKKARFIKVYSDLPINIRREVIAIINEDPISWNVAYLEIKNETELGQKILNKLIVLGFI